MEKIKTILINKNRGWRGLAEVQCFNEDRNLVKRIIFSFSENVWRDMLDGFMVVRDEDNYIILNFDNLDKLPRADQQRSVLVKNFEGTVVSSYYYNKNSWMSEAQGRMWTLIDHFKKNRNNHTTSDWNCIGVRVVPII